MSPAGVFFALTGIEIGFVGMHCMRKNSRCARFVCVYSPESRLVSLACTLRNKSRFARLVRVYNRSIRDKVVLSSPNLIHSVSRSE